MPLPTGWKPIPLILLTERHKVVGTPDSSGVRSTPVNDGGWVVAFGVAIGFNLGATVDANHSTRIEIQLCPLTIWHE